MTRSEILTKFKNIPIKIKFYVALSVLIIAFFAVVYYMYTEIQDVKNEAKIEKAEGKKVVLAPKIEAKKTELQNDVIDYGKSVKKKSDLIQDIIKKNQPFKPMKDEPIKVKDASYDAMRTALDSAMPNP